MSVLEHNPFDLVIDSDDSVDEDEDEDEDNENTSKHKATSSTASSDTCKMSETLSDFATEPTDNTEDSPVPPAFSEIASSKSKEEIEMDIEEMHGMY